MMTPWSPRHGVPSRAARQAARLLGAAVLCGLVGCNSPVGELPVVEGGRCGSVLEHCVDDGEILSCTDRVWTRKTCEDRCLQLGRESEGCTSEGEDACKCGDPVGECVPGTERCISAQVVEACTEGTWVTSACDDVCSDQVPPLNSEGCVDSIGRCSCTHAGLPCGVEPSPVCDGEQTLARCQMGVWEIVDCSVECGNETAKCSPSVDGADCSCS